MNTPASSPASTRTSGGTIALALLIDVVLVIVFAVIGRASHHEAAFDPAGLFTTAWPFVAGLLIGWVLTLAWRRPLGVIRTGLPIWIVTIVAGMLLRLASGQGTALAFIIVATITLAVFLVGWRLVGTLVVRSRGRASQGS